MNVSRSDDSQFLLIQMIQMIVAEFDLNNKKAATLRALYQWLRLLLVG